MNEFVCGWMSRRRREGVFCPPNNWSINWSTAWIRLFWTLWLSSPGGPVRSRAHMWNQFWTPAALGGNPLSPGVPLGAAGSVRLLQTDRWTLDALSSRHSPLPATFPHRAGKLQAAPERLIMLENIHLAVQQRRWKRFWTEPGQTPNFKPRPQTSDIFENVHLK